MTTAKQYDYLNRLGSISSAPATSFNYQYNSANQRTTAKLADGSYWQFGYDALGQVTSGNRYWPDGTLVAGQQFGYSFDTIGNRTQTQTGGDQTGAGLRIANYTNNALNQITSRDVPGDVDIMGLAIPTGTVTVNGQPAYRRGEYFRAQLPVANAAASVWQSITNSVPGTNVTGHKYVVKTPEQFSYDADGNLTNDGRWAYAWDAENRLTSMTSISNAPSAPVEQIVYAYDYMSRRVQKTLSMTNVQGGWAPTYTDLYVYDGWNCIAMLNPAQSLQESFLWDSDLSGSMQGAGGAGGVGGLIEATYYGTATTNCFAAFDGNGNVSALINAADGTAAAQYEYGPFGELIRATGPMAKLNPFRFSTKYEDDETDLLYYGFRYYNPSTGRWLGRDPGQEQGGMNLYNFVGNDAIDQFDELGLLTMSDVNNAYDLFASQVNGKPCCCSQPVQWSLNLTGTASGSTVTLTAHTPTPGNPDCLLAINDYFWWNCVSAQNDFIASGGTLLQIAFGNQSWHDYGFYLGGSTDTETHTGHSGWWAQMTDANHWDFYVIVFFTRCQNGKTLAGKDQSNDVQFNWNQVNHKHGPTTGYWSN
jgi:RHS repeat-associated protein